MSEDRYPLRRKVGACRCRREVPLNARERIAYDGCSYCVSKRPERLCPDKVWHPGTGTVMSIEEADAYDAKEALIFK